MNNIRAFILICTIISIVLLQACEEKVSIEELKKFRATENFPEDHYLDTVSNKRALVIVAHDDDDCAMSGTIAKLKTEGWFITQLSLQSHLNEKTGKYPADIICNGNVKILNDGIYRRGADTMKMPYYPIPYDSIKSQYMFEKVSESLIAKVNQFNPSVIFTLDNEKGGYGHPDHIFISQLVKDLFENNKINCNKIYQSVYTDHMESEIVDKWLGEKMKKWGHPHASDIANKLYGINGMPNPTTEISVKAVAETKMKYLLAYDESVKKNLRKFIPYYDQFDATTYFGIFDKEYFRVIERE